MNEYETKMMELAKKQGEAEHDKYKNSLIKKVNHNGLQNVYEASMSKAQILSSNQLLDIENTVNANSTTLQKVHYQKAKSDLFVKGQKTSMELSSTLAAFSAYEIDASHRITNLINFINNLTTQLQELQQRINQQSNETKEMKVVSIQQLNALQVEIANLQLEKQNMEIYINHI
jgi:hypothetical protein